MALFRVQATVESRAEIMHFAEIFRAKIVDVSRAHPDHRGHRVEREDRRVRAHGPPARADRDGADRRSRDLPLAPRPIADTVTETTALLDSLEALLAEAGGRRRLVSVTVEVERRDPSAAVFASRLPATAGSAGSSPTATASRSRRSGAPTRSSRAARGDSATSSPPATGWPRDRLADEPPGLPAGAGPVWVGGFAFAPDGGGGAPVVLVSPGAPGHAGAAAPPGRAAATHLTLCALAGAGRRPGDDARAAARAAGGAARGIRCRWPTRIRPAEVRIASVPAARSASSAVGRAGGRADPRRGARQGGARPRGRRRGAAGPRPGGALRGASRAVSVVLLLLLRLARGRLPRREPRAAGAPRAAPARRRWRSPARPGEAPTPSVDDHLGEQLLRSAKDRASTTIVVRRIERTLRRHSVWVEAAPEPGLVKVANIQHLATPIHAQLSEPRSAVELAGILHPTPAVGGEPRERALDGDRRARGPRPRLVRGPGRLDGRRRGRRVLRRAALGAAARPHRPPFAGNGIVADSDPAAELAETEVKLGALLPLLAG